MTRDHASADGLDDDPGDENSFDEGPQSIDLDPPDEEEPLVRCAACGHEYAEIADFCPSCGQAAVASRLPSPATVLLAVAGIGLILLLTILR